MENIVTGLNGLLDNPALLFIILAIGAAFGVGVERAFEGFERSKRRAYWQGRNQFKRDAKVTPKPVTSPQADAAQQLSVVMAAKFKKRPLLNQPERRLLTVIDKALSEEAPGWRAMGQVSLGEILWSDDKDAFWAINAKRVDLLIIDADCQPLHAIEFQGTGHHQTGNAAAARDAVKKEALRLAGIGYVEVVSGDTPAHVRDLVRKMVGKSQ